MKINLELSVDKNGDGFLNFWDAEHGNDVCCEIAAGVLLRDGHKVTLAEFIQAVMDAQETSSTE